MNTMNQSRTHQAGIVSLVVTMVMMIVISLLVLGFADLARSEQRNTLDDQLSSQAYYAAESGINDVRAVMSADISGGNSVQAKNSCAPDTHYTASNVVDASKSVSYSCALVDPSPSALEYDIDTGSKVIPLISSGASFGTITLAWTNVTQSTTTCYTAPSGNLPVFSTWAKANGCGYPVLRVDIFDANTGYSRALWSTKTYTAFFIPVVTGGSNTVSLSSANGIAAAAICSSAATGKCVVNINGLGSKTYYMRVNTIYQSTTHLTITSGGSKFLGAQAIIDSTGKAQDVLRRIRVAVDLTDANEHTVPSAALVTRDSVCKRYAITNGSFYVPSDSAPSDSLTTNAYCKPSSSNGGAPTP